MNLEIKEGNAWDKLLELEDNSIGSLVTDPPYLIDFLGNDWDKLEDNIAGNKDFWKLVLSKMKHGAHGLVFGHSRTHHRVMIALEDAGFEIRDTMMWLYGSGFPKNHDIGKSVDKLQGNEREVVGDNPNHRDSDALYKLGFQGGKGDGKITKGTSKWEGWGTALKPAYEPIILVRKPLAKGLTIAKNCLEHNVGGINIDGSRIGCTDKQAFPGGEYTTNTDVGKIRNETRTADPNPTGRYPANVILSHHPDCVLVGEQKEEYNINKLDGGASHFGQQIKPDYTPETQSITNEVWDCSDDCPAKILDQQSGVKKAGKEITTTHAGQKRGFRETYVNGEESRSTGEVVNYHDGGGASRFFKQVGCVEDCPIHILDEQAPEVGSLFKATRNKNTSGGSGDSWTNGGKKAGEDNGLNDGLGGASRFFYNAKVAKKERTIAGNNSHPTIKPVSLMYYLVNLITPEGETCLDPFMGSGATGMACALLDRDFIGIEMDADFARISEERITYARDNKQKTIKICKVKENRK